MNRTRSQYRLLCILPVIALVAITGCGRPAEQGAGTKPAIESSRQGAQSTASASVAEIDAGLTKATQFLLSRQSSDGAWRSDVYSPFKNGDALTPVVLMALTALPADQLPQPAVENGIERSIEKGFDFLATLIGPNGTVAPPRPGIAYPVYTAAGALLALGNRSDAKSQQAREAWLSYLRERQLTEGNGWQPGDAFYGGWGYDAELPKKPPAGVPTGPLTEPNLSATVFALAALRAAGIQPPAAEFDKALQFVTRCQNYAEKADPADAKFDDGGFFFVQSDIVRNKAGASGKDSQRRERFSSYGSATADGLRSFAAIGLPAEDPRVQAAWQWLAKNFSAEQHPGHYADGRQAERDSVYYYYCHSLAEALAHHPAETAAGDSAARSDWARAIAGALLKRQKPDGSWSNPEVEVREDDPLVATSLATRALAMCRRVIVVESRAPHGADSHDDRQQRQDSPADKSR
jgi:squalene-hopene/tetraprenyl-beta-curcumene cyclase